MVSGIAVTVNRVHGVGIIGLTIGSIQSNQILKQIGLDSLLAKN